MLFVLSVLACAQPPTAAPDLPDATPTEVPEVPEVVDATPLPERPAVACPPALTDETASIKGELIVVFKEQRHIGLYREGQLVGGHEPRCWPVGLGGSPVGHKTRQGDQRTPEGWYRTSDKPWSRFYGAIAVHYPNATDIDAGLQRRQLTAPQASTMKQALAKDAKPDQYTSMGGEILIHGGGSSSDWTLGCVAMDNADLDLLRSELPDSQRTDVWIRP